MQIKNHESLEYRDIILKHKKSILSSRSEADITAKLGKHTFAAPVVCANMSSLLTYEQCKWFDSYNWFYVYPRTYSPKEIVDFVDKAQEAFNVVSISVGITREWVELVKNLKKLKYVVNYFTVDVALSYSDFTLPIISTIKECFPDAYLIVGNGASWEWVEWLQHYGVDCAKINIGVSKSCRTKEFTGFSSPTIGNLIECSSTARNIKIMSDGGLTVEPDGTVWLGDIAKAIRFGADFVMSGAVFAGCIDTLSYSKGYYGNSTAEAKGHSKHVEGANVNVKKEMSVRMMMDLIEDSLRSSVSYAGGKDLSALKTVDFIDMRK